MSRAHQIPEALHGRLSKQRASGQRFLILVEGEETECRYFCELKKQLRISLEVDPADTDPVRLVKAAIKRRDAQAQRARGSQSQARYDQVWVVCDREAKDSPRMPRFREALRLAKKEKIHFAVSIPSFEVWLLLHLSPACAPLQDGKGAVAALSKVQMKHALPIYEKASYPLDFYLVAEKVVAACLNAEKLRERHASVGVRLSHQRSVASFGRRSLHGFGSTDRATELGSSQAAPFPEHLGRETVCAGEVQTTARKRRKQNGA